MSTPANILIILTTLLILPLISTLFGGFTGWVVGQLDGAESRGER